MSIIKNNSGDTIVEVLIAIVILSLILTGAYVSSNDSLDNIRDAQDRIQALGYAQNQAEDLRAEAHTIFAPSSPDATYLNPTTPATNFCFDNTNTISVWPPAAPPTWAPCEFGTIPYTVQVTSLGQISAPATTYTFRITVTWPSISHNVTTDSLVMYYRVDA